VQATVTSEAPPTDELTLARARRGDAEAFVDLVAGADLSHRRLAFRLLGDRDRIDDVLQDAYARAFRALPSFGGRASLDTWLYRIVYNTCIDELRRLSRREELPLEQWGRGGTEPRPAREEGSVEQRLDLGEALAALPAELRAVVLLVDAEGLSYTEAAEVLSIPPGTVASRLNRARAELRNALEPAEKGLAP
jgi:RNA polymerase sigma-70 factor (ECF subfamily)